MGFGIAPGVQVNIVEGTAAEASREDRLNKARQGCDPPGSGDTTP